MSRRKNTRMFPRAERRADTAARAVAEAALTPEQRDARTIQTAGLDPAAPVTIVAEAWLAELDEAPHHDRDVSAALGRHLARREGRPVSRDDAEAIVDHDSRDELDEAGWD